VVEHYLDTVGVTGSNPVSRTSEDDVWDCAAMGPRLAADNPDLKRRLLEKAFYEGIQIFF
jgi:hypothetical protein